MIGGKTAGKYTDTCWKKIRVADRNVLKAVGLLTSWYGTVLPSLGWVGGVTPRPLGFVVWVTAVVTGGVERIFRELSYIIASVCVRALAVPALAGLPADGLCGCAVILRTPCGTFTIIIAPFNRENRDVRSETKNRWHIPMFSIPP